MDRARKLIGDDPLLLEFKQRNKKRMQFFEDMIEDKSILRKKKKKIKSKHHDLLAKHPLVDWYKYSMIITMYGYNAMLGSLKNIMSFYKKDNK
jgi:hypothetical protein